MWFFNSNSWFKATKGSRADRVGAHKLFAFLLMQSVKQESRIFQILTSFGMTRTGVEPLTQGEVESRIQGGHSTTEPRVRCYFKIWKTSMVISKIREREFKKFM